jgi:hypothetical protein
MGSQRIHASNENETMSAKRWISLLFLLPGALVLAGAQESVTDPAEAMRAIANSPAGSPQRRALRQATTLAVAASKTIEDGRTPVAGEEPAPVRITENLVEIGYPLSWVVEEVVYRYGDAYLYDLVSRVVFLYGQTIKDLLRDAIREGARRRAADRARALHKVAAGGGRPALLSGLSAAELTAYDWEPVDWDLIGLSEQSTDLRFLEPNDDPGAPASVQ